MKHLHFGLAVLATLATSAFGQDSISPTTFSATLGVGGTTFVNKVVTIGKQSNGPVDVLFLVDGTGSMGPAISAIASGFAQTVTALNASASNIQFGVANFLDYYTCPIDPYAYQLNQNITANTALVQAALTTVSGIPANNYGCDEPESDLYGLQQAASTTAWRTGSKRIIIWVGDSSSHDPAGPATEATAIAALNAANVEVIAASATSGQGLDGSCTSQPCAPFPLNSNTAMRVTAATNGVDLGTFADGPLLQAVQTAIANSIGTYSTVSLALPTPPAGVTVSISPPSYTGTFSRSQVGTYTFVVNFTGTVPGVYPFPINAQVDGSTVATEQDTITVTSPFAQPTFSKTFSPSTVSTGGTSTLTLNIGNQNTVAIPAAAFTDTLPAGLVVATPNGLTNTCGGTVTATAGSGSVSLSAGTVPVGGCAISVTVLANGSGTLVNTTGPLTCTGCTGNPTATANLSVTFTQPTFSKSFTPATIAVGGTSTLAFTIGNPGGTAIPNVGFTDNLPTGVVVATPNGLTGSCGTGTITATPGSGVVTLSGATVPAAGCTFSVSVLATTEGAKLNSAGPLTCSGCAGGPATATLSVASSATVTKTFGAIAVPVGGTASLTLTINNPNTVTNLTGVSLTDTLPAGLLVATPNGLATTCGGTETAVAGTNFISVSGVSLAPGTNCTVTVTVTATGTATGTLTNTTSTVTSNQAPPGPPGTATIFIGDPYMVSYASNLLLGDSSVYMTNTGAGGAGTGSGTAASVPGSLCANIFVFDADEEIVSCCSCPVTPNGLITLSDQVDLISNPLTRTVPNSIVIKLLATVPVAGTCTNSALLSGATLANGLAAWNTTLHFNPTVIPNALNVTEMKFSSSKLSAGELNRLAYQCGTVANTGSGFGVCAACSIAR